MDFRAETQKEITERMTATNREALFTTLDGKPYPFSKLYIEDLVEIRDLMRAEDPPDKKAGRDDQIRTAARQAYDRIRAEGLLK